MNSSHGEGAARAPLLDIANILTVIRLALVPVSVVVYLDDAPVRSTCTWAVFAVAVFTDKTSGHPACSRNLMTDLGKIADSIADEALISSAPILLLWRGRLYWWITAIMIRRELFITTIHMTIVKRKVMTAGHGGKIKMLSQSVRITGPLVPWAPFLPRILAKGLLWISYTIIDVAFYHSVASTVEYVAGAKKIAHGE